jgi:hypothetical protein
MCVGLCVGVWMQGENRAALIERYNTTLLPKVMSTVQQQAAVVGKEYVGQTNEVCESMH